MEETRENFYKLFKYESFEHFVPWEYWIIIKSYIF